MAIIIRFSISTVVSPPFPLKVVYSYVAMILILFIFIIWTVHFYFQLQWTRRSKFSSFLFSHGTFLCPHPLFCPLLSCLLTRQYIFLVSTFYLYPFALWKRSIDPFTSIGFSSISLLNSFFVCVYIRNPIPFIYFAQSLWLLNYTFDRAFNHRQAVFILRFLFPFELSCLFSESITFSSLDSLSIVLLWVVQSSHFFLSMTFHVGCLKNKLTPIFTVLT